MTFIPINGKKLKIGANCTAVSQIIFKKVVFCQDFDTNSTCLIINVLFSAAPQSGPVPEEAPGAAAPRPNGKYRFKSQV